MKEKLIFTSEQEKTKFNRLCTANRFPILSCASEDAVANYRLEKLAHGIVNLTNVIFEENVDTLVLLDKSARPIAQLLKSYWRGKHSDQPLPDIRFINIGKEEGAKDGVKTNLKKLYNAHFKFFNNKDVLVVDEWVQSGSTLRKANRILGKVFPKVNKFIFLAAFETLPQWYSETQFLGVYDSEDLPFDDKDIRKIEKSEPDCHISKSLWGVASRRLDLNLYSQTLKKRQAQVNEIRDELKSLGKIAAKAKFSKESLQTSHFLDNDLDRELNQVPEKTRINLLNFLKI